MEFFYRMEVLLTQTTETDTPVFIPLANHDYEGGTSSLTVLGNRKAGWERKPLIL